VRGVSTSCSWHRAKPADTHGARSLFAVTEAPGCFIADKAYDADDVRSFLQERGTNVVISSMPTRKRVPAFDPVIYRKRNIIERAFCRLKDWRAVAIRYDKTARNFMAGVCLAALFTFWIK
jgi:putative transposase